MIVQFIVYGTARPQGSTKAFFKPGMKFPAVTTDNKQVKPWRQEISGTALVEMAGRALVARPAAVGVSLLFFIAKPKSTPKKRSFPTTKPDIDKLERAVLDALTGIVFEDDAQVCRVNKEKRFGLPERLEVSVFDLTDSQAQDSV